MASETRPSPAEISWGVIGRTEPGPLRTHDDRDGLVRMIEEGTTVEYVLADVARRAKATLPFPTWARVPGAERRFEMALGRDEAPAPTPLAKLRADLQSPRKDPSARPPRRHLDALDGLFLGLLDAVAALHALGVGAGLLQPPNVLAEVDRTTGAVGSVVLPDVGFVYFRGIVPAWLRNGEGGSRKQAFAALWDHEPQEMNRRIVDRQLHPKLAEKFAESAKGARGDVAFDRAIDLRTVARLMAWTLAPDGVARKTIPSRDQAPYTKAAVWTVLADVLAGKVATAEEFRARLEERPETLPSGHFHEQVEPPPAPPARGPWILVGSLVALAVVGFGINEYLKRTVEPPGIHRLCDACTTLSPMYPVLDRYEAASKKGDPAEQVAALRALYDPKTFGSKAPSEGEAKCRDDLVGQELDRLDKRAKDLVEEGYKKEIYMPTLRQRAAPSVARYAELFELRSGRAPKREEYGKWIRKFVAASE